jgi:hypothetical protein
MAFSETPPQVPPPTQPVFDDQGRITGPWYDFFVQLRLYLIRMGASIP